jgi:ketosteroid isomerase-like protein
MNGDGEKTIGHALLILALILGLFAASGARSATVPEQELKDLEQARSEAIRTGDLAILGRIYSDDFQGVTTTGALVDKEKLMSVFRSVDPRVAYTNGDIRVQVIGQVALVSGLVTGRAGGEMVSAFRYLHVYVQREGRWQLSAGQSTNVSQR